MINKKLAALSITSLLLRCFESATCFVLSARTTLFYATAGWDLINVLNQMHEKELREK